MIIASLCRPSLSKQHQHKFSQIIKTVQKVIKAFDWKGAVGISVTRQVFPSLPTCQLTRCLCHVPRLYHALSADLTYRKYESALIALICRRLRAFWQVWRALGGRDAASVLLTALPNSKGQARAHVFNILRAYSSAYASQDQLFKLL